MTSPNSSHLNIESSRDLITRSFKRKLKKMFAQESKSTRSPNSSANSTMKKNVSWSEKCIEQHSDKSFRSTPFPQHTKKLNINNSTPVSLEFYESDDEYNFTDDSFSKSGDVSNIFTGHISKRKRTDSDTKWTVTACNSDIKPDKKNAINWKEKNLLLDPESESSISLDSTSEQIIEKSYTTENNTSSSDTEVFDEDKQLAKTIIHNIKKAGVVTNIENLLENYLPSDDELSEYFEYTDSELENDESLNEEVTCQQVTVTSATQLARVAFNDSSCEDEPNDAETSSSESEEPFDAVIISKKPCEILEPELSVKLKNKNQRTHNKNTKKKNVSKKEEIKEDIIETELEEMEQEPVTIEQNNVSSNIDDSQLSDESELNIPVESTELQKETEVPKIEIEKMVKYHISNTHCIILLKHPVKLYFHGKLSVIVLSGAIEVLGHVLEYDNGKEFEIYSPRGSCFLSMETLDSKRNKNLTVLLKEYNMTDEQIEELCIDMKEDDCIIAAREIQNDMISYLEKHVAQQMYPKFIEDDRPLLDLEAKLHCLFEVQVAFWKVYKPGAEWPAVVNSILSNSNGNLSRVLLCGGKSVGKSVLLRYMINSMLNSVDKVVCIDLDLGQSEFTVGGCVSVTIVDKPVFGPNYTHLRKPEKSFFVGDISIVQCLGRYLSCVKQLLAYCNEHMDKSLPWIINYMGFTKSIGTDLIVAIIKLFSPTLLVQIQSENNNRNYSTILDVDYVRNYKTSVPVDIPNMKLNYTLQVLNSEADYKVQGEWECEPRQIREMCILSYFSQMLQGKSRITSVPPYVVKLSSVKLHHVNYEKENMPAILNGNIVALCQLEQDDAPAKYSSLSCLGFGIVRGIDIENDSLYLLTPTDIKDLDVVNCLSMGTLAVPPSIYMTPGHEGLVPYIQLGVPQGTSLIPKRYFRSCKSILKKQ